MNPPQNQVMPLPYIQVPAGPLSSDSSFYIERPPLESLAFAGIAQGGNLLRLKAPRHMGKSSLLLRIEEHARGLDYATCTIDFLQTDTACFQNLSGFLRWLCRMCTLQLGLPARLDEWWDDDIGSKVSSTIYFEHCVLSQLTQPLVLFINEVNRVFEYGEVAEDFLSLLRYWHEQGQRSPIWQKLRLVLAYSTEVYVPLKLEQSPFNVGTQLYLPEFTPGQVRALAERYDLPNHLGTAYEGILAALIELVGGHPYLVHIAIAHLRTVPESPATLLASAATSHGIYGDYLRRCAAAIRPQSELIQIIKALLATATGLRLPSASTYQLHSLGIVKTVGGRSHFACELFRQYFQQEFGDNAEKNLPLDTLRQENQRLQNLAYTDALTQIPNRRAFDQQLAHTWQTLVHEQRPLTLMMCDIDLFKQYNDTHGHPVGDQCLRLVAQILRDSIQQPTDFVARYGGEEFAVILPYTDIEAASARAEQLRSQIREQSTVSPLPPVTVSIGVASILPSSQESAQKLVIAADRALYESKRLGRDRITVISKL